MGACTARDADEELAVPLKMLKVFGRRGSRVPPMGGQDADDTPVRFDKWRRLHGAHARRRRDDPMRRKALVLVHAQITTRRRLSAARPQAAVVSTRAKCSVNSEPNPL